MVRMGFRAIPCESLGALRRLARETPGGAVLVVDSTEGATDQDAAIAGEADKAGCGIIIAATHTPLGVETRELRMGAAT